MKRSRLLAVFVAGLASLPAAAAFAEGYHVCKSTYALCTGARCTREPGQTDTATCTCEVRTGHSVGTTPCQDVKETNAGTQVLSRYYPIKSYVRCTNDRPWALCHDKVCVVDKDDPGKAKCTCSVKAGEGDYVRVTDAYTAETCSIGLHSAATVDELHRLTNFLKEQVVLAPFPIRVLSVEERTFGSMTPSSGREPD